MISHIISLPILAFIIGLIYVCTFIVHNIFFHPLRKYPGPFYHRINRWALAYYQWKGDAAWHVLNLHKKYGSIVRIGPNELSYSEERAWTDIYGHQLPSGVGNLPKDLRNIRPEENGTASIIFANDIDHRRLRRIQTHMFSEKAISAQESYILGYVSLLISRLREIATSPLNMVDISQWYNLTTVDVIGELAFGEPFDCLRNGRPDAWIEQIQLLLKDAIFWGACGKLPWPIGSLLYRMTPRETREARNQTSKLAQRKVEDRIVQSSHERIDFMSYILKHQGEKGMTRDEIDVNARLYMIAGSETTSTFLSGLTYNLLVNNEHLRRLTQLIRTTFPLEKDICLRELNKLEYLTAVIEESFRLYPPVPGGLLRCTNHGGSVICGEVVPENTTVSVHILSANMTPRNWTDPEKFVPERWCRDDRCPERYRSDKRKSMQQFSIGPRNCIGKNMAYSEMRMIIAHVLWNFDLEMGENLSGWLNQSTYAIWEGKPLRVRLNPRKI